MYLLKWWRKFVMCYWRISYRQNYADPSQTQNYADPSHAQDDVEFGKFTSNQPFAEAVSMAPGAFSSILCCAFTIDLEIKECCSDSSSFNPMRSSISIIFSPPK